MVKPDVDNKKKKYKSRWIWIILLFLLILIFLSGIILIVRMVSKAPIDTNTVFLETSNPKISINDKEQVWNTENEINVFNTAYKNELGSVIVKSDDDNSIIAPGSSNEYTFNLKNIGDIKLDYKIQMSATMFIENNKVDFVDIPIKVRIKDDNDYLLGTDNSWVAIQDINSFSDKKELNINNYAYYTFEWKWDFNNDDLIDTNLGIMANEKEVKLILKITTNAKISDNLEDSNEAPVFKEVKDSQNKKSLCPVIIILIIIFLVCLIVFKTLRKKIRGKDND